MTGSGLHQSEIGAVRLLDLFCCQGGAGMGYHSAGFDVTGVDLLPQPRYPFPFVQHDALKVLENLVRTGEAFGRYFDAIHASPPCQAHSKAQRIRDREHPEMIEPLRFLLKATGLPYVIENVPGAPLLSPIMLCGSMFPGLRVYRHREFEANFTIPVPAHPEHVAKQAKMGRAPKPGEWVQAVGNFSGAQEARDAMAMQWATREGLREAIPPAYTEHIGRSLMERVCIRRVAETAA